MGRYGTSFLTNGLTSTPGASLMAAKAYGSVYAAWNVGMTSGNPAIAAMMSMQFSPSIYLGLNAIQKVLLPNYPYGYEFFRP